MNFNNNYVVPSLRNKKKKPSIYFKIDPKPIHSEDIIQPEVTAAPTVKAHQ